MKEDYLSSNEWENGQWSLAQEVGCIYEELGEIAKSLGKIRQRLANIAKAEPEREVVGQEPSSLQEPSLQDFPVSQMDERLFHPSFDMCKLKQVISDLGILPSERNRWCVVFLALKENSIIASNASEQEFIRWARDVFGVASGDFRHCLNGAKALPTCEWNEALVSSKYISLASQLRSWASCPGRLLKRDRHGEVLYFDSHHKWSKMKA